MHLTFNAVNVVLSYANIDSVPVWVVLVVVILGAMGFIFLVLKFFRINPYSFRKKADMSKSQMKKMITREGYVSVSICFVVMGMLVMINN